MGHGNPERSPAKRTVVAGNVQRLGDEDLTNKPQKRPTPQSRSFMLWDDESMGDEIVRTAAKAVELP